MTPELDATTLRQRAKRGVVFLAVRALAVQAVTLFGNIALARQLTPSEFGTFGVVQFVLSLFTLLGDVGLGAALVQRRELPDTEELSSVFWLQLGFALAVVALVFGVSPWIVGFWPDLPAGSVDLLRLLSVSFVFTMVRVVPSVLLERELSFGKLAILEVASTFAFYATATSLAYSGQGVDALLWAVLVQALLGVAAAYSFRPWRPRFAVRWAFVRGILGYGVAFQTKNLVGFANSAIVPLVAGRLLGTTAVGYVTWAQSAAYQPLRVVQLLSRVNFPLLSRLQDQPNEYRRLLERGLEVSALAAYAFVAVCFGLGEPLVRLVYGARWIPAMPVFYVFVASVGVAFIAPMVTSALEAIGKPRLTASLSLAWMVLNWLVVGVVMWFERSLTAFALAFSVHVFVGNLGLLWISRTHIPGFGITRVLVTGSAAATLAAVFGRWFTPPDASLVLALGGVLMVLLVYVLLTFSTNRRVYREAWATAGLGRWFTRGEPPPS